MRLMVLVLYMLSYVSYSLLMIRFLSPNILGFNKQSVQVLPNWSLQVNIMKTKTVCFSWQRTSHRLYLNGSHHHTVRV